MLGIAILSTCLFYPPWLKTYYYTAECIIYWIQIYYCQIIAVVWQTNKTKINKVEPDIAETQNKSYQWKQRPTWSALESATPNIFLQSRKLCPSLPTAVSHTRSPPPTSTDTKESCDARDTKKLQSSLLMRCQIAYWDTVFGLKINIIE